MGAVLSGGRRPDGPLSRYGPACRPTGEARLPLPELGRLLGLGAAEDRTATGKLVRTLVCAKQFGLAFTSAGVPSQGVGEEPPRRPGEPWRCEAAQQIGLRHLAEDLARRPSADVGRGRTCWHPWRCRRFAARQPSRRYPRRGVQASPWLVAPRPGARGGRLAHTPGRRDPVRRGAPPSGRPSPRSASPDRPSRKSRSGV
jgi:hypothetical protein